MGFSFDLVTRNNGLSHKGFKPPKATSTGTTIVGCLYKVGGNETDAIKHYGNTMNTDTMDTTMGQLNNHNGLDFTTGIHISLLNYSF